MAKKSKQDIVDLYAETSESLVKFLRAFVIACHRGFQGVSKNEFRGVWISAVLPNVSAQR